MKTYEIELTMKIAITQEDIDDIVTTAFEGGITYWCCKAEVVGDYLGEYASEQISRGGTLKLYDAEDDAVYELTLEKLLNGIAKAYSDNWHYEDGWCDGKKIDTCQVDANVADTIIQLSLFDEVIYG